MVLKDTKMSKNNKNQLSVTNPLHYRKSKRGFRYTLPHGGAELSPSGGARKGAGRKKGKITSDSSDDTIPIMKPLKQRGFAAPLAT
jgi:hypothetical protein